MANTRSAKKSVRKNEKRRLENVARRSALKTAIKKVRVATENIADNTQLDVLLKDVAAQLARAKGKNVLHPNTASRKLSRLAKKVAAVKKGSFQTEAAKPA